MSKRRRVRPPNSAAIEATARALSCFYLTGKEGKLRTKGISALLFDLPTLAICLRAIADGEDAREIFGQTERNGRQREGVINTARSVAYWYARALKPSDVDGAVKCAGAHFAHLPKLKAKTIERNARKHKRAVFWILQSDFTSSEKRHPRGVDLTPLKIYLKEHTKNACK